MKKTERLRACTTHKNMKNGEKMKGILLKNIKGLQDIKVLRVE
jgi:hypothetical protein